MDKHHRFKRCFGYISVCAVFLLSAFFCPVSAVEIWVPSVVDKTDNVGFFSSLAIDSKDNLLISYLDGTFNDLKLARSSDSGHTWTITKVDTEGSVGHYSSITTDTENSILISYQNGNDAYDLKFARSTDGGVTWTKTTVDSANATGYFTSIAVDASGNYLISYYDSTYQDLRLAKSEDKGRTWTTTTVDSIGNVGQYSSIDIDPSGNYIIAYRDTAIGNQKFTKSTDGGVTWSSRIVDTTTGVGLDSSLVSDPKGNYLISHFDGINGDLRVTRSFDGGLTWSTVVVEHEGSVGTYTSISARYDNYYISYFDNEKGALKIARSSDKGATWNVSVVDNDGWTGYYTSLEENSSDELLLSYYDGTNGTLKFARSSVDNSAPEIVLSPLKIKNISDNTPRFTGVAQDKEFAVESVEFQVDRITGTWITCSLPTARLRESFELESFPPTGWLLSGDLQWIRDSNSAYDGIASAAPAPNTTAESAQKSTLKKTVSVDRPTFLSYQWKTDTSQNATLTFCIDTDKCSLEEASQFVTTGIDDWTQKTVLLQQGVHSLTWVYEKKKPQNDIPLVPSQDTVWIDQIVSRYSKENFVCDVGSAIQDGDHTIYFRALDSSGNSTDPQSYPSISFTVDTIPPKAKIEIFEGTAVTNPKKDIATTNVLPEVKGISDQQVTVNLEIPELNIETNVKTGEDGMWTWVPKTDLPHGAFTLRVEAVDQTGNKSRSVYDLNIIGLVDTGTSITTPIISSLLILSAILATCTCFKIGYTCRHEKKK